MASLKYKGKRHLPLPKGPYTVGCTDIMTGNSIQGIFMRLYYPCRENGILEHYERWPLWAPNKCYISGYASFSYFESIATTILDRTCGDMHIPAIVDAVPLSKETPFPLVIYSHGLFACRTTYSTTCVELASHGYVVAALEHRDKSACYTYYLKNKTLPEEGIAQSHSVQETMSNEDRVEEVHMPIGLRSFSTKYSAIRNKQLHQRAKECSKALDLLQQMNEGIEFKNVLNTNFDLISCKGMFEMSKVVLAGHSFGGATTLLGLANDLRFRIGLTLDVATLPLELEKELPSRISQPILFIKSSNFYNDNHKISILNAYQSNKTERKYVTVCGTTHTSQCDLPFMVPNMLNVFTWGQIKGNIVTHMNIHNRLIVNFLSKHLDLPVNSEYESYIVSQSTQIKFGADHLKTSNTSLYAAFIFCSIFVGALTSFIYWFKVMKTTDR